MTFLYFFHVYDMIRFDRATYLSLYFKFNFPGIFSNSLWGSDVLLFLELINVVYILFYNFIEFMILLYTILVLSFCWYKEYIICLILFNKFSDVLPTFTCPRPIDNLWKVC